MLTQTQLTVLSALVGPSVVGGGFTNHPAPIIVDGQSSTLNLNQASCLIERPLFEGREFRNVCTGQVTLVPYSVPEIIGGIVFAVFFLCILSFIGSVLFRVSTVRRGF